MFSVRSFKAFAKAANEFNSEKRFKAHLKLDTGMNRLGFKRDETSELIELLLEHSNIEIASIFTHFAASEDESHDAFTQNQITDFENRSKKISEALGYAPVLHAANTGGTSAMEKCAIQHGSIGYWTIRGIGLRGGAKNVAQRRKLKNQYCPNQVCASE